MSGTLTPRSLVTLDEAKAFCGVDSANNNLDNLFLGNGETNQGWIDLVSAQIEDYIGYHVKANTIEDEILDGTGTCELYPNYYPIQSVSSLKSRSSDGTGDWADLLTDIALADVNVYENWKVILLGGNIFPKGQRNIKITYVNWYGSSTSDLPGDLVKVCLEMIYEMYLASGSGKSMFAKASSSITTAGQTGSDSLKDMKPGWKEVLDGYRRRI